MAATPEPHLPRSDLVTLLWGVFFIFAPLGALWLLALANTPGWLIALLSAALGGLIAVGWCFTFTTGRYWVMALVIPFMAGVPLFFRYVVPGSWHRVGADWPLESRRWFLIGLTLVMVVVGYVLSIRLTNRLSWRAARAQAELDVARRMHESIVPAISIRTERIEVHGRSDPSSEMGGDLIDAVVRDGEVDVFLADVSGHGVGAGVVMSMVKSSIRTLVRSRPSLASLTTDLNAVLSELTTPEMFATFACLRLGGSGEGEFALAGHLPLLHFIAAEGVVRELPNDNLPLGIDADERFASGRVRVAPGDTLALYTDGLIEVMDAQGRQLGLAALRDVFAREARRPLSELAAALMNAARSHGAQSDDQSVVLVRVG